MVICENLPDLETKVKTFSKYWDCSMNKDWLDRTYLAHWRWGLLSGNSLVLLLTYFSRISKNKPVDYSFAFDDCYVIVLFS